jgi:cation diffusion facilitator CzcD-associated flavoprotein CzcO
MASPTPNFDAIVIGAGFSGMYTPRLHKNPVAR